MHLNMKLCVYACVCKRVCKVCVCVCMRVSVWPVPALECLCVCACIRCACVRAYVRVHTQPSTGQHVQKRAGVGCSVWRLMMLSADVRGWAGEGGRVCVYTRVRASARVQRHCLRQRIALNI